MVEVLDGARVQVLHHVQVGRVRPVLDLNLSLSRLLHAIHEHASEVLALCCKDSLVAVDGLLLDEEDDVGERWIVDDRAHVHDQVRHGLVVDLVLLELADVQDAYVVQPLAPVEAAEDEQLLRADHAGSVTLTACRRLLELQRVRPAHGLCVQHVEIVRRNDFLEASSAAVVAAEQINLRADQVGSVATQALGWTAANLRLRPAERLGVEHVQVLEVLVARVTAKQV